MSDSARLSSALARSFDRMRCPDPAHWLDVLSALPPDAWTPYEGEPSLWSVLMKHSSDSEWQEVFDYLDARTPWPKLDPQRLHAWLDRSLKADEQATNVLSQWVAQRVLPWLSHPEALQATLVLALQRNSEQVALAILQQGKVSKDLSKTTMMTNPFAHVATYDLFQALIEHGFDPLQGGAEGEMGEVFLRQRTVVKNASSSLPPYRSPNDQKFILNALNPRLNDAPDDQAAFLERIIQFGRSWSQLHEGLKHVGENVWTLRFEKQQTLLHRLAQQRPEWLESLFRWSGLRQAPDDFFAAVDDQGVQALWHRLVRPDHVKKFRHDQSDRWDKDYLEKWLATMDATPYFSRWIHASQVTCPDQVVDQVLRMPDVPIKMWGMARRKSTSLLFWELSQRTGGPSPWTLLMRLDQRTDWQDFFDAMEKSFSRPSVSAWCWSYYRRNAGDRLQALRSNDQAAPKSLYESDWRPASSWLHQKLALGLLASFDEPIDQLLTWNARMPLDVEKMEQALESMPRIVPEERERFKAWKLLRVEIENRQLHAHATSVLSAEATCPTPRPRL